MRLSGVTFDGKRVKFGLSDIHGDVRVRFYGGSLRIIPDTIEAVDDGGQIKAGAEAFRRMLLEATQPLFWPHIEGVFKVFAEQHGFAPEEVLDEMEAKL